MIRDGHGDHQVPVILLRTFERDDPLQDAFLGASGNRSDKEKDKNKKSAHHVMPLAEEQD
jgi:hypothetical protein